MKSLRELKKDLLQSIGDGNIKDVAINLRDEVLKQDCSKYLDLIQILSRYNRISKRSSHGTIDENLSIKLNNKLSNALTSMVGKLTNKDLRESSEQINNEKLSLLNQIKALETDKRRLRDKIRSLNQIINDLKKSNEEVALINKRLVRLRKIVFTDNNFQIIKGNGKTRERILKENKIKTWKDLNDTDVRVINKVLEGIPGYINAKTLKQQAKFILENKWKELLELQQNNRKNSIKNTPLIKNSNLT